MFPYKSPKISLSRDTKECKESSTVSSVLICCGLSWSFGRVARLFLSAGQGVVSSLQELFVCALLMTRPALPTML